MTSLSKEMAALEEEMTEKPRYSAAGQVIVCPHCRNDRFDRGEAQLNTAGMTFLELDWANRSATILHCTKCGHIVWFSSEVTEVK